jgi:hypothetical protein
LPLLVEFCIMQTPSNGLPQGMRDVTLVEIRVGSERRIDILPGLKARGFLPSLACFFTRSLRRVLGPSALPRYHIAGLTEMQSRAQNPRQCQVPPPRRSIECCGFQRCGLRTTTILTAAIRIHTGTAARNPRGLCIRMIPWTPSSKPHPAIGTTPRSCSGIE